MRCGLFHWKVGENKYLITPVGSPVEPTGVMRYLAPKGGLSLGYAGWTSVWFGLYVTVPNA